MALKTTNLFTGKSEEFDAVSLVCAYHQLTKHLPERPAPGPGYLDWENQPDPFRRFSGASLFKMPLHEEDDTPRYDSLFHPKSTASRPPTLETLGLFLELSLGISAWKAFQDTRWALRCNPSSGNLHPTEGYVVLPSTIKLLNGDGELPHEGGVYHYAPKEHALEQRCRFNKPASDILAAAMPIGGFLVGLTSVHWRETWKYGERAYRYCQHDVGHALGALSVAAATLGWRVIVLSALSDDVVAGILGIDRNDDFFGSESENPDLIAVVLTTQNTSAPAFLPESFLEEVRTSDWTGKANRLSSEQVEWRGISIIEEAAFKPSTGPLDFPAPAAIDPQPSQPTPPGPSAATIIRQRRSAVDMDGQTGLSCDAFLGMLARTLPHLQHPPWTAIGFPPRINLCLFVHRIEGLPAGLYVLMRDEARLNAFRAACHDKFAWAPVTSGKIPLYALDLGDYRQAAVQASCGQDIAGDGAFSLGMMADFSRTLEEEGAWAYRRLFWESGMIGQMLYLEAEAAGVRATGIGCYFDDVVHRLLGLDCSSDNWQSLYHFTVGGAVVDERLTTLPAYHHLPSRLSSTDHQ